MWKLFDPRSTAATSRSGDWLCKSVALNLLYIIIGTDLAPDLPSVASRDILIRLVLINKPSLNGVPELELHKIADNFFKIIVINWDSYLDPVFHVSHHPICGTYVHIRITAIMKNHDPRMLKEPVHDTDNSNPVAHTGHAGDQGAHAPHANVYTDTGPARLIQLSYQFIVCQVIDLQGNLRDGKAPQRHSA